MATQSASGIYLDAGRAHYADRRQHGTRLNCEWPDLTALVADGGAAGSCDVSVAAAANALLATLDAGIGSINTAGSGRACTPGAERLRGLCACRAAEQKRQIRKPS